MQWMNVVLSIDVPDTLSQPQNWHNLGKVFVICGEGSLN